MARGQIPFENCDGAEGGTRTPTGFPRPATPFSAPKIELFARGLRSVPFSLQKPERDAGRIPTPKSGWTDHKERVKLTEHGRMATRTTRSGFDQDLESAVDHALAVEGHRLRIHHLCQARIFHYLCVHAIAMRSRLEHDPREHHRLAALELDPSRERNHPLYIEVVTGALLPPLS